MASKRRVLVYGGRGALGSVCVRHFRSKDFKMVDTLEYYIQEYELENRESFVGDCLDIAYEVVMQGACGQWVGSVDLTENEEANVNVVVKAQSWQEQEQEITSSMAKILGEEKVDGIFCVAGGWAGGNAASKTFVKSADAMWKQSVWTSVIASSLATKYLKEGGVLTLAGAQPALQGTPGMIGYGMAKAAVHHLTKSLSAENSGLPPNSVTFATLPITLDTPMNRKWMSNADKSTWTPLEFIADLFLKWTEGVERPGNGSLVQFITKGGETELVIT